MVKWPQKNIITDLTNGKKLDGTILTYEDPIFY